MSHITFTTTTFFGESREITAHDDVLLYDSEGNRAVDPTTLEVGDKLRALAGCPPEEITAKVVA